MSSNHIRYLSDRVALCEQPARLDNPEFLHGDFGRDMPCKECSKLLMVANRKAYDADLLFDHNQTVKKSHNHRNFKSENAAFHTGVLIGAAAMFVIIVVMLAIFG